MKNGKITTISIFKISTIEMIFFQGIYDNLLILTEQLTYIYKFREKRGKDLF